MHRDSVRMERIRQAIASAGWDALVCGRPLNVLMLSGYWPVVGNALAIVTRAGQWIGLAPEDEAHLASQGWAEVRRFEAASLEDLHTARDALRKPLAEALGGLGRTPRIAHDGGAGYEPGSYVSMHFFGSALDSLIRECAPAGAVLENAEPVLADQRASCTQTEVEAIRAACRVAQRAFEQARQVVRPGVTEIRAARQLEPILAEVGAQEQTESPETSGDSGASSGGASEGVRAGGSMFCMSGANAARAYAAFQISSTRELRPGDLALLHCNSVVGGFWTDITRTFVLGEPTDRQRKLYEAIFAARAQALKAIKPGVKACVVDEGARQVMKSYGWGENFRHPAGHGVGYVAIDHNARPRLHPKSSDVLAPGMVFNLEPGLYFDGEYGIRHCDMVLVTANGAEVLTPFQDTIDALALKG